MIDTLKAHVKHWPPFVRYSASGIASLALELALLFILIGPLHVHYLIAIPISLFVAVSIHFVVSHQLTFSASKRPILHGYGIFLLILISSLLIVTGLSTILIKIVGLGVITSRILAGSVSGVYTYILNATLNFKTMELDLEN